MNGQKETPLEITGIDDDLYAGFWSRLGANLLDFVFIIPVVFIIQFLNSFHKDIYFATIIPNLLFMFWYHVYLPKQYGGTPGKLLLGMRIIRMDGYLIDWPEALLRHSVMLVLSMLSAIMMMVAVLEADNDIFMGLSWMQQTQYLAAKTPVFTKVYTWASNIWVYSELIVLLLNERKRAIHDFIAGTVVVKDKYVDEIQKALGIIDEMETAKITPI